MPFLAGAAIAPPTSLVEQDKVQAEEKGKGKLLCAYVISLGFKLIFLGC